MYRIIRFHWKIMVVDGYLSIENSFPSIEAIDESEYVLGLSSLIEKVIRCSSCCKISSNSKIGRI